MANVDSVFKSRDITLPRKVRIVKAMVFPVVMYGCESWTIKAEHLRSDVFKLVLKKTLESHLDSKEVNQLVLKEINPEYGLEGLQLKFQYCDHLMQRAYSLEKTLILGKIKGKRRGR